MARTWVAVGFAGVLLLGSALRMPDGVVSPAASLSSVAPWQEAEIPEPHHEHLRDVTFFVQPWLVFYRAELREGRLPFWNPHQMAGTPFWSNGQSAPLFPLHLLFAALPLQLGLAILPWLRLLLAGLGAHLLARELGLSHRGALLAAIVYPFSGMFTSFLLFPLANSLALVPWVLLAVERLAGGRSGWALLGLAAGVQLVAGHPETVAMTALLSALYLLVRRPPLRTWPHFAGGWLVAAALAAAAILPFFFTMLESAKWLESSPATRPGLGLVFDLPWRAVLPGIFGHPADGTWWGPFNYEATAVYAGLLALPLAFAGLLARRREAPWKALAAVGLFAFAAAYHLPGIFHLLAALPVFQKALFHYFLFGVELALALFAGAGLDAWLGGERRTLAWGTALYAGLLGLVWLRFGGAWAEEGLTETQIAWTAGALVLAGLIFASLRLEPARRRALWGLVPMLFALDLVLAHGKSLPALSFDHFYPRGEAVEFLARNPGRIAAADSVFRPNAATVYRVDDVRGEDPLKLERWARVDAELSGERSLFFEPLRHWDSPWLDRLGVRWVLTEPGRGPIEKDWRLAHRSAEAWIWRRPNAQPLVRWRDVSAAPPAEIHARQPGYWEIYWRELKAPELLVFAETWDTGWRAEIDGRRLEVERVEGLMMGVELEPGEGWLTLRYRPRGFRVGSLLSLLAAAVIAMELLRRRTSRG